MATSDADGVALAALQGARLEFLDVQARTPTPKPWVSGLSGHLRMHGYEAATVDVHKQLTLVLFITLTCKP